MKKLTVKLTRTELIFGLVYLLLQVFVIPSALVAFSDFIGAPMNEVQLNFVFFCVNFIAVTVILHRFLLKSGKIAITSPFRCVRYAALGLMLFYGSNFLINYLILAFFPAFFNVNDAYIVQLATQNNTLMLIGSVLLVPVVEETLFRGVIFSSIYQCKPWLAYVVSTLAFSVLHIISYIGVYPPTHLLICFIQYLPAGICFAWVYVKADSVWAPILMHMANNQIAMFVTR